MALVKLAEFTLICTQLDEVLALLRELEWTLVDNETGVQGCPICWRAKSEGHAPDCKLAKVLEGGMMLFEGTKEEWIDMSLKAAAAQVLAEENNKLTARVKELEGALRKIADYDIQQEDIIGLANVMISIAEDALDQPGKGE